MRRTTVAAVEGLPRGRARAAPRTLATSSSVILSMESEIVPPGLATKSTAPKFSASKVASAPSLVSDETITTATGRSAMISESAVSPSICGMLMSSVTTSGWKRRFSSTASSPLRAW